MQLYFYLYECDYQRFEQFSVINIFFSKLLLYSVYVPCMDKQLVQNNKGMCQIAAGNIPAERLRLLDLFCLSVKDAYFSFLIVCECENRNQIQLI